MGCWDWVPKGEGGWRRIWGDALRASTWSLRPRSKGMWGSWWQPTCATGLSPSFLRPPPSGAAGMLGPPSPCAGQGSSQSTQPWLLGGTSTPSPLSCSPQPCLMPQPLPAAPQQTPVSSAGCAHPASSRGSRAASRCQAAPAQLALADFGAVRCQSLLQLIFPLPRLPPLLAGPHPGEDPSISAVSKRSSWSSAFAGTFSRLLGTGADAVFIFDGIISMGGGGGGKASTN